MPPPIQRAPWHPGPVQEWVPEEFGGPAVRPAARPAPASPPAPTAPVPAPVPAPAAPPPAPDRSEAETRAQGYQAGYAVGQREAYAAGYGEGHKEGYREGRAAGYADGRPDGYAAGQQDAEIRVAALHALLDSLETAVSGLHLDLAEEVLALSLEIARKLVGHALHTQPEHLLDVIQTALTQVPQTRVRLHLHPQDIALVREHLPAHPALAEARLIADPQLRRGDCTLESDTAQIDATVATRWARLLGAFPDALRALPPPAAEGA